MKMHKSFMSVDIGWMMAAYTDEPFSEINKDP